jgi:hypothetical protein
MDRAAYLDMAVSYARKTFIKLTPDPQEQLL